jgi:hypothetical protein
VSKLPKVYLCAGSDCSSDGAWSKLRKDLKPCSDLREVRCQKICDGPVCGFDIDGVLTWLAELDSERTRCEVTQAVQTGELTRRLRRRAVAKRQGQLR